MSLRQTALDLAILGRLKQGPSHGYEVRKHVTVVLGSLRRVSFGSIYPALRRLMEAGLICDCGSDLSRLVTGRSRRVYHLTPSGEEYLSSQLGVVEPHTGFEDFGVRFSLLGLTDRLTRMRILRGRRDFTASQLAVMDSWSRPGLDRYSQELVQHSRDVVANELAWLDRVLAAEESEN